jgi:four helix bundle protein
MLKVHGVAIEMLGELRPVIVQVERKDIDLARQLRRAASSIALNMEEGSGSSGGIRRARYRTAYGSARETRACLEVAKALGYVGEIQGGLRGRLNILCVALWKLAA